MKTFTNMAAQGDFIIFRVDTIPENLEKIRPEQGYLTIAHSETGHDHVMLAERTTAYKDRMTSDDKLFELFLSVEAPTEIIHKRSYDTHEALLVPAGNYVIKRQREYTPEGYRRAAD